jgi:coenzyme F420 hydrogenase subunit beta
MLSTYALDSQVIQKGLCTGCGACQGLCPYWGSVRGRTVCYYDCERSDGRCQRFCPRMPTDLAALRQKAFPGETILPELGPYRALYLARAADGTVRAGAQHGGTVTALVELALREGVIDGALLSRARGTLEPAGEIVTDPAEVRRCSGSSFQIPPTLAALNCALQENTLRRIGVVGTPCKTLAVCKMRCDPLPENGNHAENIALVIGLFCGWGLDWDGMQALTERCTPSGAAHVDILPSKYHSMELTDGAGRVTPVDLDEVLPLVRPACRACADMTAEFADLSVGGARSADGWETDKKWNQVIVRSKTGEELLELARSRGVLEFKDVPDTALDKLKAASMGKKRTAVRTLHELCGGLGYLAPNAASLPALEE